MAEKKDDTDQMWHDWFMTDAFKVEKRMYSLFRLLPDDPRCRICHSPFNGIGGVAVGALFGRKQSSLNPRFCNVCEDIAKKHPGGAEVEMSMLFADVRGSTALSEGMAPSEFTKLINRFYIGATNVITEEDGLVEKLAGDAVAAFWGKGFAGKNLRGEDCARRSKNHPGDAKTGYPGRHRRARGCGFFRRHGLRGRPGEYIRHRRRSEHRSQVGLQSRGGRNHRQ